MKKPNKKKLPDIRKVEPFKPISISDLGGIGDPCFGKLYDLTTTECKRCGDSELCCTMFAQLSGKTRDQLNKEKEYLDLDNEVDIPSIKKYIRKLKRDGKEKKDILDSVQKKFEISRERARLVYKEYVKTKK